MFGETRKQIYTVLAFATAVSFVVLSGCTQSGGGVAVHRYGDSGQKSGYGVHTIQNGETLWAVSQAYQVELRDLLDLNHLNPPYNIRSGTRIRIPSPRLYTVQKGDTIYRLSRVFNTSSTELARLNRLKSPYRLSVGQSLKLPGVRRQIGQPPVSRVANSAAAVKVDAVQSEQIADVGSARQAVPPPSVIRTTDSVPQRSTSGFLRPVSGKVISGYGPKKDGLHNDGINIQASKGTAVRAAENGTVAYVGDEIDGYGNLVLIRHRDGYITAYAHLDKKLVKKGDVVKRGQTIGTVGTSGHVDVPQLHFEVRKGKKAINPLTLI